MHVTIGDDTYEVVIVRKLGNRNTYIRVKEDMKIHVTTNTFVSTREIEKLIYKNTGFSAFQKKYATEKENELIKILWRKYPYYKKEDIEYCVEFIDKDEEIRDNIYEMFGLINKPKIKKLTKAEVNKRKQHMDNIIRSDSVLDLL